MTPAARCPETCWWPSTWEAEAESSRVQGQPELHSTTLFKKKKITRANLLSMINLAALRMSFYT
jgi:hypothetical protein